jgi:hypothetical protein
VDINLVTVTIPVGFTLNQLGASIKYKCSKMLRPQPPRLYIYRIVVDIDLVNVTSLVALKYIDAQ